MKSALEHRMETGFVTMEEIELGMGGKLAEGLGHAADFGGAGLFAHGGGEHLGFHGPGAAEAPETGGHFLEHAEFEVIDRGEALDEEVAEGAEGFGIFLADEDGFGEESVA